jgi:hypothetical protein
MMFPNASDYSRLAAMLTVRLYVRAALPALLCLLAWQGSAWAVEHLNCVLPGKELSGCMVAGLDVTTLLGFALFWGGVLIIPAVLLSVIMLTAVPVVQRRAANKLLASRSVLRASRHGGEGA